MTDSQNEIHELKKEVAALNRRIAELERQQRESSFIKAPSYWVCDVSKIPPLERIVKRYETKTR